MTPDHFKGLEFSARREFQDRNFVEALELTNKIRVKAGEEDQSPLIVVERRRVTAQ